MQMLEDLGNRIWNSVPAPILWGIALTIHTALIWYGLKLGGPASRPPQD